MLFLRKHRHLLLAAGAAVLCLLIFSAFWLLDGRNAAAKAHTTLLNDVQNGTPVTLRHGSVIEQTFTTEHTVYGVGLLPEFSGQPWLGTLHLKLYNSAGALLADVEGPAQNVLSGTYSMGFHLPAAARTDDGVYRMELSALFDNPDASYTLLTCGDETAGWQLTADGQPVNASLCMRLTYDFAGRFISVFYWVFSFVLSACIGGLLFLALRKKTPVHRLFALALLCAALLYCVILPPYASPDEQFHINQCFNLSSRILGQADEGIAYGTNVRRASDVNALVQDKNTTVFTYRELASQLFTLAEDNTPTVYPGEEVGGAWLMYLPATLGLTLARLLGLGFVPTLFIGRLCMMACFIVLATLAVRYAPLGKSLFAGVALLPMTLHLAASFSRDGLNLAILMLFTSLCLYYTLEKPSLGLKDLLLLAVLAVLGGPAKVIYMPLILLCMFIPSRKLTLRSRPLPKAAGRGLKCGILLAALVALFIQWGGSAFFRSFLGIPHAAALLPAQPLPALPWADAAQADTSGIFVEDHSATFGLGHFFNQPFTMLMLIARTVFSQLTFWYQTMLGSSLGYYSLPLNAGFTVVFTALLLVALLPTPQDKPLTRAQRLWAGVLVLVVCGAVVLGCVFWTPVTYSLIYGIQGRYFLPALPLALCVLSRPWFGITKSRALHYELIFAFAATSLLALFDAFLVILAR